MLWVLKKLFQWAPKTYMLKLSDGKENIYNIFTFSKQTFNEPLDFCNLS